MALCTSMAAPITDSVISFICTCRFYRCEEKAVTDFENIFNSLWVLDLGGISRLFRNRFCRRPGYEGGMEEQERNWPFGPRGIAGQRKPKPAAQDGVEFARARFGFEPDEKQAEVLRSEAGKGIPELYAAVG
jgi:hypothetical protein